MVNEQETAWLFLAYLLIPIVVLVVAWLVSLVLRKVFKKGTSDAGKAEEE